MTADTDRTAHLDSTFDHEEVRRLPGEDLIYVAILSIAYGEKTPEEIKERSAVITVLQAQGEIWWSPVIQLRRPRSNFCGPTFFRLSGWNRRQTTATQ